MIAQIFAEPVSLSWSEGISHRH